MNEFFLFLPNSVRTVRDYKSPHLGSVGGLYLTILIFCEGSCFLGAFENMLSAYYNS